MPATTTFTDRLPVPAFPIHPPVWANVFGEDDFGIFAEFAIDSVSFRVRWIPPGSFQMGSPKDEKGRWDDESPQHEVTITRGFWFGDTPVTQSQWQAVAGLGEIPSRFKGAHRPVESVSWHDCLNWFMKLKQRIPGLDAGFPTEAQWEYACRTGTTSAYNDGSACTEPEGNDPALDKLGWFGENSANETHEVKQKKSNTWGLYDLHGNVWEWCLDEMRDYGKEVESDPLGSTEETAGRAVRGGGWAYDARFCRSACRDVRLPDFRFQDRGFRLAASQTSELRPAEPEGKESGS